MVSRSLSKNALVADSETSCPEGTKSRPTLKGVNTGQPRVVKLPIERSITFPARMQIALGDHTGIRH